MVPYPTHQFAGVVLEMCVDRLMDFWVHPRVFRDIIANIYCDSACDGIVIYDVCCAPVTQHVACIMQLVECFSDECACGDGDIAGIWRSALLLERCEQFCPLIWVSYDHVAVGQGAG